MKGDLMPSLGGLDIDNCAAIERALAGLEQGRCSKAFPPGRAPRAILRSWSGRASIKSGPRRLA
jgi:hypothetical protein